MLEEHASVLATKDLSDKVLVDCKGTVVFVYNDPRIAYEVEFFDEEGYTLELLTVQPDDVQLKR